MFLCLNKAQLHNFADKNAISPKAINVNELIKTLEKESEIVTDYFRTNEMIVNPDKFQAIVVKRDHQMLDSYPLHKMNET